VWLFDPVCLDKYSAFSLDFIRLHGGDFESNQRLALWFVQDSPGHIAVLKI
jgi:hypothetical protein